MIWQPADLVQIIRMCGQTLDLKKLAGKYTSWHAHIMVSLTVVSGVSLNVVRRVPGFTDGVRCAVLEPRTDDGLFESYL
jgi:hypothetical protein